MLSDIPQGLVLGRFSSRFLYMTCHAFFLDPIPWTFADNLELLISYLTFPNNLTRMYNSNNKIKSSKIHELLKIFKHLKEIVAAVVITNNLKQGKYLKKIERGRYRHYQSETNATIE